MPLIASLKTRWYARPSPVVSRCVLAQQLSEGSPIVRSTIASPFFMKPEIMGPSDFGSEQLATAIKTYGHTATRGSSHTLRFLCSFGVDHYHRGA